MRTVTSAASFADATAVTSTGPGRYIATIDGAFSYGAAPNGGYLLATMLRAATAASTHAHPVAASVDFTRVADLGRADVEVDVLHTGRSLASARVTMRQDAQVVAHGTVTLATLEPDEPVRWSGSPPEMPSVDACPPAGEPGRTGVAGQIELRFDPAIDGWRSKRPTGHPELRAWFRLRRPTAPDPYVLAFAADALPPVTVNLGLRGWAPTARLTWHLRALPAPGWVAVHARSRSVTTCWFDEDVEIWDSAGRLVAQSRQLAMLGRRHTPQA
jgi:acyl-CoA thioesterase